MTYCKITPCGPVGGFHLMSTSFGLSGMISVISGAVGTKKEQTSYINCNLKTNNTIVITERVGGASGRGKWEGQVLVMEKGREHTHS